MLTLRLELAYWIFTSCTNSILLHAPIYSVPISMINNFGHVSGQSGSLYNILNASAVFIAILLVRARLRRYLDATSLTTNLYLKICPLYLSCGIGVVSDMWTSLGTVMEMKDAYGMYLGRDLWI